MRENAPHCWSASGEGSGSILRGKRGWFHCLLSRLGCAGPWKGLPYCSPCHFPPGYNFPSQVNLAKIKKESIQLPILLAHRCYQNLIKKPLMSCCTFLINVIIIFFFGHVSSREGERGKGSKKLGIFRMPANVCGAEGGRWGVGAIHVLKYFCFFF